MRILKQFSTSTCICGAAVLLLLGGLMPVMAADDLDVGSEATMADTYAPISSAWYNFGGTSQAYSGTNRGRGNTFTVTQNEQLNEFTVWLDFSGTATLYFYVLESSTLGGTYTPLYEGIETIPSVGTPAYYSSGPINVDLQAGMFYGIGVAWGGETVSYYRDSATLPRVWDLGTVEDSMQITGAPPYTSISYNHYTGSEYCMQMNVGDTAIESSTWGRIKNFSL